MNSLLLSVCTTADTAAVYWEKPSDTAQDDQYTLMLDEKQVAITTATHFLLQNLSPTHSYTVTLCRRRQQLAQCVFRTHSLRRRLDVTAAPYFAKNDGITMNTQALQKAFDDCGAEDEVYFPAGVYLTGALNLHSHMAVYLEKGAVLQGSEKPDDYLPRILSRFEGIEQECYRSLLNAGRLDHNAGPNCEDILLYGAGTISGGGKLLAERMIAAERENLRDYLAEHTALVAACENDRTIPGRVRGRLLNFSNCAHVRITGLTLQNGASWNVHMVYCNDIVTDHCVLRSAGIWNGDGWDPDSSENCTLFATLFDTEDDSVAIKSGKNPEGNHIARPSRHIRVFACRSLGGHGLCIGSEISGGVEDVQIWDCDMAASSNGIEIKGTPKRGGYVRNVTVRDCSFPRLLIHAVPYNDDGIPAPEPPIFENYYFERLYLTGEKIEHGQIMMVPPIEIEGFAQQCRPVQNVTLLDCILPAAAQVNLKCCRNLKIENLQNEKIS